MIQVDNLTRRYGPTTAVNDVSFRIDRGEVVGLLGHNAAGKTTIMKMISGYLEPTAGTIRVGDLEMGRDTRAIQARLGYLPENCPVWPEMTVIDYLDYQASLHGVPEDQRERAVANAIRRTELRDKAADTIETLSRGYRQRVGVAQALLHDPDVIILDEPTNGLDPNQIRHMRDLIRELALNATVVVSTHILQEVQAVCERVLDGEAGDSLGQIDGVTAVEDEGTENGLRQYLLETRPETAPAVAEAVAGAGLKLYALHPRRRDLETLFAEINEEVAHG
jgi:ABC-2 type transport system ATP-binding protein